MRSVQALSQDSVLSSKIPTLVSYDPTYKQLTKFPEAVRSIEAPMRLKLLIREGGRAGLYASGERPA